MKGLTDIKERIVRNRTTLLLCFVTTFIWGLAAHGYRFFNNAVSHDSIIRVVSRVYVNNGALKLGRIFYPPYQAIVRGFISVPWLIGLLALVYISLALFLLVKLFQIKKPSLIILLSGILVANITVISTAATYIEDLDGNMFAMLLSVISVYLWRNGNRGFLWGALPLCLAIGIYQCFISVAITLIIILSILDFIEQKKTGDVLISGLKGIGMIFLAGILYFIALKIVVYALDVEMSQNEYNSLDTFLSLTPKEMIESVIHSWDATVSAIRFPAVSIYTRAVLSVFDVILLGTTAVILLHRIFSRTISAVAKLLTVLLFALLPLGMNTSRVLANNMSHDLMHYSLSLSLLLVLLLVDRNVENSTRGIPALKKAARAACMAVIALIVLGNVRVANQAYFVKDFEQDATMSLMTRVTAQMEACETYVPGETPVVVIGEPAAAIISPKEYQYLHRLTGMHTDSAVTYPKIFGAYYEYVLMTPINHIDDSEDPLYISVAQTDAAKNMPTYPTPGSVQMIDGVMVIRFQ